MRNYIRIACLIHDGRKAGDSDTPEEHTNFAHPLLEADAIMKCFYRHPVTRYDEYCKVELPLIEEGIIPPYTDKSLQTMKDTWLDGEYRIISSLVSTHMGEWNTSKYSDEVLPLPTSKAHELVHYADYLASQKWFLNTDHLL